MAQIYWDMEHYAQVEKIFRQSAEFCSEHDTWKLNVAHTFFMQVTNGNPNVVENGGNSNTIKQCTHYYGQN
eukprot:scaffold117312_cov51-Prasinocladus_malaysianus.AAC.1